MKTVEIARLFSADLEGEENADITGVADLRSASGNDLAFTESCDIPDSGAGLLVVPQRFPSGFPRPLIRAKNPKLLFSRMAAVLVPQISLVPERHSSAHIHQTARVGRAFIDAHVMIGEHSDIDDGCYIHAGVSIGSNVKIGANTRIHANCTIYDGSIIGKDCVVHAGSVIGTPGFGYVKDIDGSYQAFPQLGRVLIGNRVEIGANTCVDRGALGDTVIGDGTKIDNQVQVAHNVRIGRNVVIAAQTGISGSTVIEDDCVIGGQVGIGDHVVIRSGAVIGSQAGILPGKIVRPGVWWGTPIQPLDEYKRQNARVKGLARLADSLKEIRSKLDELLKSNG